MNTTVNGEIREQVMSFSYLEHIVTDDERSETEIKKTKIGMAKIIFLKQ